ncbi:MAG: tetratricopeptide repeat protein [Lachnospiraceae bacterium]|nr:tetratricopeptide repeat protein [Lachnospiraceae bacterium]
MANKEIWKVLEIEQTRDEDAIKTAYRRKVVTVNPEDDPEGFQKLREAYDEALRLANQPEEEEQQEPQTDLDRLMARAEKIYMNLDTRMEEACWKEWLAEPLCEGLDTADEVREALLAFLMGHFYLPHEIWELFDKQFQIVSEQKYLADTFPVDYLEYVKFHIQNEDFFEFHKLMDRSEMQALFSEHGVQDVQIGDGTYSLTPEDFEAEEDSYIHLCANYLVKVDHLVNAEEKDASWQELKDNVRDILCYLESQDIWHPFEYIGKMRYLSCTGDTQAACEMARNIIIREILPAFDCYAYACAGNVLLQAGTDEREDIEKAFDRVLEDRPGFAMALLGKARLEMAKDNYQDAKEYVMKVFKFDNQNTKAIKLLGEMNEVMIARYEENLRKHPDSQEDWIELGWCLFQCEKGQEVIDLLDRMEPDEEHIYQYMNLRGRCLCNMQRYEEALPYLQKWKQMLLDIIADAKEQPEEALDEETKNRISRIGYCYYLVGLCLKETGNSKEAEQMLLHSIEEEENETERVYYREALGQLYQETERYQEALDTYNKMIDEYPHCVPAYVHRQELYFEQHDGQGVVDDYYHIIEDAPDYAKAYVLAARVFLIYEQYEDARRVYENAREHNVKSNALLLSEANCFRDTGDYDKAAKLIEEIAEHLQDEDNDIENLCEFYNDAAYLYLHSETYDKAASYIKQAFALDKKNKRAMWLSIDLLKQTNAAGGKIAGEYKRMLALYDDDANVHYEYGVFLMRTGDSQHAEEQFKAALERMPEHPEANDKLMRIYQNRYVNSEQESCFETALVYANRQIKNNDAGYFYVDRGLLFIDAYRFDEAISDFERALEQNADNIYAKNACGYCYMMLGDYEKAEHYLQEAVAGMEKGETVHPYINLAKTYEMQGKYDGAIDCYRKLLEEFGEDISWHQRLAVLNRKKGAYRDAMEEYQLRHRYYIEHKDDKNQWIKERLIQNIIDMIETSIMAGDKEKQKEWSDFFHKWMKKQFSFVKKQLGNYLLDAESKDIHTAILKAAGKYTLYVERDYVRAERYLKQAYRYMQSAYSLKNPEALKTLGDIYSDLAETCYRLGKVDKARRYAHEGLHSYVKACGSEEAYAGYISEAPYRFGELAMLYFYMGDKAKAEHYAKEMGNHVRCSFCRQGKCYEQYLCYARMAEAEGNYEEALKQYRAAGEYGPEDCEVQVAILEMQERLAKK